MRFNHSFIFSFENVFITLFVISFFQLISVDIVAQSKEDDNLIKTTYMVQQGEGLYMIARKFNVSIEDLCKWNNLTKDTKLILYQKLIIYEKTADNTSNQNQTTYTVQPGDGLYAISRKLGVSVDDLYNWNYLNEKSIIYTGQKLIVYQQKTQQTTKQQPNITQPAPNPPPPNPDTEKQKSDETERMQKQRIMFFGDSMLEGMRHRIRQYAYENDHETLNLIWYSSSTKTWAEHIDTLTYFMNRFKPTYIIIVLGANELNIKDIVKKYDPYVKKIMSKIDGLPYVWVGPPNWKEDTGINTLIENNVGSERFFLSKNYTFNRTSDGAHLLQSSAEEWMDKIALWLNDNVPEQLQMNVPKDKTKMKGNTSLLQPLR